jgi:hypothetical protein
MLCLLECTTVEVDGAFSPPPFEAVMGLTQAMQAAAVHRQIQADMLAYCLAAAAETQAAAAAAGETGELRAAAAATCSLPGWAKSSQWARSTGGELDEHGAPVRAQTGVWKDLWDYTLASSHAAAAAAAPPPPPPTQEEEVEKDGKGEGEGALPAQSPEPEMVALSEGVPPLTPRAEIGELRAAEEDEEEAREIPVLAAPRRISRWIIGQLAEAVAVAAAAASDGDRVNGGGVNGGGGGDDPAVSSPSPASPSALPVGVVLKVLHLARDLYEACVPSFVEALGTQGTAVLGSLLTYRHAAATPEQLGAVRLLA